MSLKNPIYRSPYQWQSVTNTSLITTGWLSRCISISFIAAVWSGEDLADGDEWVPTRLFYMMPEWFRKCPNIFLNTNVGVEASFSRNFFLEFKTPEILLQAGNDPLTMSTPYYIENLILCFSITNGNCIDYFLELQGEPEPSWSSDTPYFLTNKATDKQPITSPRVFNSQLPVTSMYLFVCMSTIIM